jgi:flagellar biosynthesis protein FliQ
VLVDQEIIAKVMSDFITSAMYVCGPILLVTLVVGVVVGVIQAVTQVQEMTLTFVPKMIAIAVLVSAFGWWMLELLMSYMKNIFETIPLLVI